MSANIRFEDWEAQQALDPEFQAAAEDLEPAYQVARLRLLRGLTQEELAEMVGTKQPSIARLESGKMEPRLSFLRRVVEAMGGRLQVRIMPQEGARPAGDHRPELLGEANLAEANQTLAGETMKQLLSHQPEDVTYYQLHQKVGSIREALADYEQALAMHQDDQPVRWEELEESLGVRK